MYIGRASEEFFRAGLCCFGGFCNLLSRFIFVKVSKKLFDGVVFLAVLFRFLAGVVTF